MRYQRLFLAGVILILIAGMVRGDGDVPAENGADLVYTVMTGQGEWNVFARDVDNPDAEPVALTHEIGLERFLEDHPEADVEDAYPLYQDTWRLDSQHISGTTCVLRNLLTHETINLTKSDGCGSAWVSPGGRYIAYDANWMRMQDGHYNGYDANGMWLYDVETQIDSLLFQGSTATIWWLDNTYFLLRDEESGIFLVYDVTTQRYYRLRSVLNRVTLTIETDGAVGWLKPEVWWNNLPVIDENLLPNDLKSLPYAWSPDGRQVAYTGSDMTLEDNLYCDGCLVELYDVTAGKWLRTLLSRPGEQGGFRVMSLDWSHDGAYLLAEFYEIGSTDQANEFWLIRPSDDSARPIFSGTFAQWLH